MSRLIAIALPCALCACASDAASRAELAALRQELSAIRRDQQALEQRLERMEILQAVVNARRAPADREKKPEATPQPKPAGSAAPALPSLTVVKLHPKAEPPPKIDTTTEVVEPAPDVVADLSPPASAAAEPDADAAPADAPGADREFDQALEALRTGNLDGGVQAFLRFADAYPKNARADNALYFAALGLIGQEDSARAADVLQRLISDYPAGDAVQDGMLKLAECRTKLKQAEEARRLYHRIIETYPGTAAANQAEARLASLRP